MLKFSPTVFRLSNYDAICCDIGDVLFYDFPVKMAYSYYFKQRVIRHRPELDLGPWSIITAGGRHEGALKCLEHELWEFANREAWAVVLEQWSSLFRPIPMALTALSKLGAKRLALVANQPPVTLELLERLGHLHLVEQVILDSSHGISKPDVRLLALALARLGVQPGRSVMIGDRLDNDVHPAKQLGMAAIWTQPLLYDPGLPVPHVPKSWRTRYESGRVHQISRAWAAYAALPSERKPDACVTSLSALCDDT